MQKEEIKDALRELHDEGYYIPHKCPFDEQQIEALKHIEPLPPGAIKMVVFTWNILQGFGKKIGNAIGAGLFVFLIVLVVLSVFGVAKVVAFVVSLFK